MERPIPKIILMNSIELLAQVYSNRKAIQDLVIQCLRKLHRPMSIHVMQGSTQLQITAIKLKTICIITTDTLKP